MFHRLPGACPFLAPSCSYFSTLATLVGQSILFDGIPKLQPTMFEQPQLGIRPSHHRRARRRQVGTKAPRGCAMCPRRICRGHLENEGATAVGARCVFWACLGAGVVEVGGYGDKRRPPGPAGPGPTEKRNSLCVVPPKRFGDGCRVWIAKQCETFPVAHLP